MRQHPPFSGYTGVGGGGGGGGAPTNAEYLTLVADPTLTDERVFTLSPRLAGTDGGAGGTYTVDLALVAGLAPGAYTNASLTVNAYGQVTSVASGPAPVTAVNVDAGELTTTGGTTPSLGLATAGTAGTYAYPASLTTDAFGRVTAVTAGAAPVASGWTDGGTVVYLTTDTDQVGIGTNAPTATYKAQITTDATNANGLYLAGGTSSNDRVIGVQGFGTTGLCYMMQTNAIEYWGAGTTPATAFDFRAYRSAANTYLWDRQGTTPMLFWFEDTLRTTSRRVEQTTVTAASLNINTTPSAYDVVLCDPTLAPQTITLPTPGTSNIGRRYTIKRVNTSANTVTVNAAAGNIDGAASRVLAGGTYDAITVVSDGTNWWII